MIDKRGGQGKYGSSSSVGSSLPEIENFAFAFAQWKWNLNAHVTGETLHTGNTAESGGRCQLTQAYAKLTTFRS